MAVLIQQVHPNSPADAAGIQAGETLVSLNGNTIMDVLDYRFYETDSAGGRAFHFHPKGAV